jgi:hypothetical protein
MTTKSMSAKKAMTAIRLLGTTAIPYLVEENSELALGVVRTKLGRLILTHHDWGQGWTALHAVVAYHRQVALELIRSPKGRGLLECTKDDFGKSALTVALRHDDAALEMRQMNARATKPVELRQYAKQ